MNRLTNNIRESLIKEAKKYEASEYILFEDELGWQDWMNDFTESGDGDVISVAEINEINDILAQIFEVAQKEKEEAKIVTDRDFDIITPARQMRPNYHYDCGYIVKFQGDVYFICNGDKPIEHCEFFNSDIARTWCFEDYDPEYYRYFTDDDAMSPLDIEI